MNIRNKLGGAILFLMLFLNPIFMQSALAECVVARTIYSPETMMNDPTLRVTVSNNCDATVYALVCIQKSNHGWSHQKLKIKSGRKDYYETFNPLSEDSDDVYISADGYPNRSCD